MSQFSKIFEKLLFNRVIEYLEKFKLLSTRQYGFCKNSSTIHAIADIYNNLTTTADKRLYNCCLFLDLSKAFDTVNHKILLWKLERYFEFRGPSLNLFRDYLNNRFQYTKIANCESNLLNVTCGVLQGSSLGPLLFLMYINDLPSPSEFSTTLIADDTYLNMSDANLESLQSRVNCELNKINNWFSRNKLSLNYQKSNYVLINKVLQKSISAPFTLTINKALVERKKAVKYL